MNKGTIFILISSLALISFVFFSEQSAKDPYSQWKQTYECSWSEEEDVFRRIVFLSNLQIIEKHNSDPTVTYRMAVNQFTPYTDEEFSQLFLMRREKVISEESSMSSLSQKLTFENIDWTAKGMVSPVKNQGACGSCWAFSAIAVAQSFSLFKGQSVDLSEQQLVDCSHLYGNLGCDGGFNYQGLAYIRDHGIQNTSSYPYVAKNQACKIHGGSFKISHVKTVRGCANLQAAIQQRPVGVSVDATNWSRYGSGIFSDCGKKLDHNVLLVGLTDSYYKIKNSWSTGWGEKGFIRLALGNTCGICDDLSPWAE